VLAVALTSCSEIAGGAMIVVTGTGAGQYRRVVNWAPGTVGGAAGTFDIDSPLAAPLGADSMVEVMPMRGRSIFHNTRYRDVGAFQFYGIGVDNMIHGMTMERGGGFAAWGQDRGTFVNPNLMNQFIGNTVVEGLRAEHQGTPLGRGGWGDALQFDGHVFAVVDAPPALNHLLIFRNNTARSNGGFYIGGSSDVLLDGNTVLDTPNASVSGQGHYHVAATALGTLLVGNK